MEVSGGQSVVWQLVAVGGVLEVVRGLVSSTADACIVHLVHATARAYNTDTQNLRVESYWEKTGKDILPFGQYLQSVSSENRRPIRTSRVPAGIGSCR